MTAADAKKLRDPFDPKLIGKLPKPTKADNPKGTCKECGGYHGLPAVHLDYVGHAATTDRLLSVDPNWTWAPMAVGPNGEPLFVNGGLWITLTVCGVTRPGYGDGKTTKEIIGDAIRNAAMRFGVALDLWAKEDLHASEDSADDSAAKAAGRPPAAGASAGQAASQAPAAPVFPSEADLDSLYDLVGRKGGPVDTTRASAQTAREQGKLAAWFPAAVKHWEAQSSFVAPKPREEKAA